MKEQAKLEYFSKPSQAYSPEFTPNTGKPPSRVKIFIVTFLCCLIGGLLINYLRPAVYQSSATLLTSAATAIDQSSKDVDFQHVTIQKQKLLGAELLSETLSRIKSSENNLNYSTLSLLDIRNMLTVAAIEETNLLDMSANGPEPEILPVVINTWIDVYLDARALSVKNSAEGTVELVKSELAELDLKIEQGRKELDEFRRQNDINSTIREENESPAILKGYTKALNKANEEVVKAKAKLDATNSAIANGQAVVPEHEQRTLVNLEKRHQKLTEQLDQLDEQFTRDYQALKSSSKYIPKQIEKLEKEIKNKKNNGKSIVWTEANQAYYAAQQVVAKIRIQLDNHKKKSVNFSSLFSKHQKLVQDLEALELINRETRDRLAKIESKHFEKYPQVDVIDRASVNMQAISPDYNRGTLIALIASLLIAFITVWLCDFLMKDRAIKQEPNDFPLTAWLDQAQVHQRIAQQKVENVLEQKSQNGLPHLPAYQKISDEHLQILLNNADNSTQQLILLLLSGLTLAEIAELKTEQINLEYSIIQFSEHSARKIPIGKHLEKLLTESVNSGILWGQKEEISVDELNALLYCSVVDLGLHDLDGILAKKLRETYVIYLVEQGIRLALLEKIVGYLSPLELASYAEFSPAGEGCDIELIQQVYPL